MKKFDSPADSSFILRLLYIPCIIQTLKIVLWNSPKNPTFPAPRFEVFSPFLTAQSQTKQKNYLLKALISKFKYQIIGGLLVTAVWVMLNLFTPSIVKEFFSLMKLQTLEATHIHTATFITEKFIALQLLRAFFSGHVSRIFYELSLKAEGSLGSEIIGKALRLDSECRLRLPDSQVFQLENVDLKIISKMFSHLWLSLEIPLTLLVAVTLLFRQSITFGFVGLYWVLLAFFWQRWLSDKLISCNLKNSQSIQERSKANYQVLQKIRLARLDHSQSLLVEQNNNYFLRQHRNHEKFNEHQSLFEISLVLLPILVVITIFIYDKNESVHITIQEVYLLLTLLGICYKPLKNLQKFMILIFNALHSLRRIEIYLDFPENNRARSKNIKNDESFAPHLKIKRNTMTMLRVHHNSTTGARAGFYADQEVQLDAGNRLVILGRKGQGTSILLRSLIGEVYTVNGLIKLEGTLAYLPEVNEFFTDTIIANIAFYNKQISQAQVLQITSLLGLDKDLKFKNGLKEVLEQGKFTDIELKKIGIARVLCSKRKVYLLDSPFLGLTADVAQKLEKFLRLKQQEGVMIIMTQKYIRFGQDDDMVLIISQGQIQQYGKYDKLMANTSSSLHSFLLTQNLALSDRLSFLPVIRQFQQKIKKILLLHTFTEKKEQKKQQNIVLNKLLSAVGKYTIKLKNENDIKKRVLKLQKKAGDLTFFQYFMDQLRLSQWFFISFIILVSELLHVFIQYQIGQEYKKGGSVTLNSLGKLVKFELFITCGLAFLIYLQYHTISLISNIIGNKIYEKSLVSASNKTMSWYNKTAAPLIANKYNHDYSEIYSMVKYLMDIVKYFIVLITTLLLIDASPKIIMALTSIIAIFYFFLLKFFRRGELTLLKCHSIYKHDFVTVFDEVIQGGLLINLFGKNKQAFQKAKNGFISVSSYRQAVNNAKIFQNLICQLTTTLIIALGLQYGTIMKIKAGQQNQALVAVSVLLLFNLSDVFKSLMQTIISAQSFFKLKLIPVIQVIDIGKSLAKDAAIPNLLKYNISFSQVIIKSNQDSIFEIYPFTLNIAQGQNVILYEEDSFLRNNLLLALTNNLPDCGQGKFNSDVIKIGNANLRQITKQVLRKYMGVLLPQNFYFSGTLIQNLRWKNKNFDEKEALILAEELNLHKEIPEFSVMGLNSPIQVSDSHRQLSRKLAVMKAVLRKVKILVIKDTPWFVAGRSIAEIFKAHGLKSTTIIGITSDLSGCEGAERLVYLQKFRIIQDAKVQEMMKSELSLAGALLRSCRFRSLDYWRDEQDTLVEKAIIVSRPNRSLLKSILKYSKHLS